MAGSGRDDRVGGRLLGEAPAEDLAVEPAGGRAVVGGLGGLLFVLDVNSAQASDFGNFYELYAIAGAVLGGCALRGGEGSILGVLLGATLMQTLRNAIRLSDLVPDQLEFAVIGVVILGGVSADELVKRWMARPRFVRQTLNVGRMAAFFLTPRNIVGIRVYRD